MSNLVVLMFSTPEGAQQGLELARCMRPASKGSR